MKDVVDTSPAETGFNQLDVEQIVRGMFDRNKTIASLSDSAVDGKKLTLSFTNKNADGSSQTVTRSFINEKAAKYAKQFAGTLRAQYHSYDRTAEMAAPSGLTRTNP
ncbi:MAG: hypothetical protein AAF549_00195 [Pseudomonadota bacterium]